MAERSQSYTVKEVEEMLLKFLSNEIKLNQVATKACLKVILSDLLSLDIVGVSNKNRSKIYNFMTNHIFYYQKDNSEQGNFSELICSLRDSTKNKIDELLAENESIVSSIVVKTEPDEKSPENYEELPVAKEVETNVQTEIHSAIEIPTEQLPSIEPIPQSIDESTSVQNAKKNKRKSILRKREDEDESNNRKLSVSSTISLVTVSSSYCELLERASSAEFQPSVRLNRKEWEQELEKLKNKRKRKEQSETSSETPMVEIPPTIIQSTGAFERIENETTEHLCKELSEPLKDNSNSDKEPKSDDIKKRGSKLRSRKSSKESVESNPSINNVFNSVNNVTNKSEDTMENINKQKYNKKKKVGPKKVKQRRSTHKESTNTHYNIENYFSRLETDTETCKKSLMLDVVPTKLCNYSFNLHPDNFDLTMNLEKMVETQPLTDLDIHKVLYWPGVGVKLSLPEIEIVRYCNANVRREILPPYAELDENDKRKNSTHLFRFYQNSKEKSSMEKEERRLSQIMVLTYLDVVLTALRISKFPKKEELEVVLEAIVSDLSKTNICSLHTSFSYFCNKYQYYRVFHPKQQSDDNLEPLVLRETYNPEIVYTITRCTFEEKGKIDTKNMEEYFKKIITDKEPAAMTNFNNMLRQNYLIFCVECKDLQKGQFSGPLKIAFLSEHLEKICATELDCVNCLFRKNADVLASYQWKHECI